MSLRVLAIDDSRTMRNLLLDALTSAGFTVETAVDGVDGLERLESYLPDVIVTDINMPRLDGFGVIEAVRADKRFRAKPVIVVTTESSQKMRKRARAAGATGWIVKPFDKEMLAATIRRVAPRSSAA